MSGKYELIDKLPKNAHQFARYWTGGPGVLLLPVVLTTNSRKWSEL